MITIPVNVTEDLIGREWDRITHPACLAVRPYVRENILVTFSVIDAEGFEFWRGGERYKVPVNQVAIEWAQGAGKKKLEPISFTIEAPDWAVYPVRAGKIFDAFPRPWVISTAMEDSLEFVDSIRARNGDLVATFKTHSGDGDMVFLSDFQKRQLVDVVNNFKEI